MLAEVRTRRARPSYKAMFELPADEDGGIPKQDASSDSAFEFDKVEHEKERADDEAIVVSNLEQGEGSVHDDDLAASSSIIAAQKPKRRDRPKQGMRSTNAARNRTAVVLAPGLSRPNARQSYALPLPCINHRHHGIPVHLPPLRTLRLLHEPRMFAPAETVFTNSVAKPFIGERILKASNNSVGKGPVWELMEDRSWFKEYAPGDQSRKVQYCTLQVKDGWQVLSPVDASPYLPRNADGTETSPPLTCFFGPHDNQTKIQMMTFQALKMSDFSLDSKAHVFYTGAPVWAIDWCPICVDDLPRRGYKQYLAVAPFPSHSHEPEIGRRATRPSPSCIQIWALAPTQPVADSFPEKKRGDIDDVGSMSCEMVLCLDCGPAFDLKWCPLPAHDEYGQESMGPVPQKLGILAGTFEDGSLALYVVPDPYSLSRCGPGPLFVRLEPHLRVELDDTLCLSLDWANSDTIAVGCANGSVAVFHVKDALEKNLLHSLRPSHYIALHQAAVRAISWVHAPPTSGSGIVQLDRDPTVIISGGYDGAQIVTDIRDLRGNLINRSRDVINSVAFSYHWGGPVLSDQDHMVKAVGLVPSMLGRGHALLEASGPVWSIATSDFHAQVAIGSADGTCQTTNITRSTRRSGAVPFFIYKIYQIDYSRSSGEYRMLENLLPYEYQDKFVALRATKKTNEDAPVSISTGIWCPQVSVTRVTWQSGAGLARAPLLASATASGLCRVDWLLGRFAYDRFPYHNIERLRGEVEGAEEDEEDD